METCRNDIDINPSTTNGVNQVMLIINAAAPFTLFTSKRFRFAYTLKRMLQNVSKQGSNAFQNTCVTSLFPVLQVFCCLGKKRYFHISSNVTTLKLPFFMSSSPLRKISTIAGEDIIYSVSSIARFFADSFLRAFKAFFIKPSSSAMILSSRNNSAFSCNAVISSLFNLRVQNYELFPNKQIKTR